MAKGMKMTIWGWILSFFILVVLVNTGTVEFLNFNLLSWVSFGIVWLRRTVVAVVSVLAFLGLILLLASAVREYVIKIK